MKNLILLIILLLLLSGCIKYDNCGSDFNCFQNNLKVCSKSKFLLDRDEGRVMITLRGINGDNCGVSFKINDLGDDVKNSYPNEASELIDKTMNCFIPFQSENENKDLDIMELSSKLDDYCTGQIKEIAKGPLKEILLSNLNS